MNRGVIIGLVVLTSSPLFAHVSTAEGVAHAVEHGWILLLVLAPVVVMMFRPLARCLRRINKSKA